MNAVPRVQPVQPRLTKAPKVKRTPVCCRRACTWVGFNFWMCETCGQVYVVRWRVRQARGSPCPCYRPDAPDPPEEDERGA